MAINVLIGDAAQGPYRLEADPTGLLNLPAIWLAPLGAHQPAVLVRAVFVEVHGKEEGVLLLGPAYLTGGALRTFEPPQPLLEPEPCPPLAIRLHRQELPAGRYLLKARVVFQQPPAFPGARPGNDATINAERFLEVPDGINRTCFLSAAWKHRELTVGQTAAELRIIAEHLPRGVVPVVSVHDPNRVLVPALADALTQQLQLMPAKLIGEHDSKGNSIFEQSIELRFDGEERPTLVRQAPLSVELCVTAHRTASGGLRKPSEQVAIAQTTLRGEETLRIDFPENMFPGYPVLDLGTSSTFALLYFSQLQTGLLPIEQEQTFRGWLDNWFSRQDELFGTREWHLLLDDTAKRLKLGERGTLSGAETLKRYLMQSPPTPSQTDHAVHALLRALEASPLIGTFAPPIQLDLRRKLADMYTCAFQRFPLQQQRLLAVELDLNRAPDDSPEGAGAIAEPIPSTTAVLSCHPLTLDIGTEADSDRLQTGASNPTALLTQFHSSPKNYYSLLGQPGESVPVSIGTEVANVTPREFLVAALKRLRGRIEEFCKKSGKVPLKRFGKLVMPFPTSAPLSVRHELLLAAAEAGFDRPSADLDEALSAVVFYLVSPFGVDLEMGLEAFRTSCRPVFLGAGAPPREWVQNILLIDIGGGTTDIALIEVLLMDMQAKGAGDGSRGRYYKLTPKLLGATGRGQLAGNLLSLGVFHALKKRIADAILSALDPNTAKWDQTAADTMNVRALLAVAQNVHSRFKDDSGSRYRPGAILEHYSNNQLWEGVGPLAVRAFYLVNDVLPTAWSDRSDAESRAAAAQRFYTLWQMADDLKVKVFGKKKPTKQPDGITVSREQIGRLLGISAPVCEQLGITAVSFGTESFREAIDPPLLEIARLALDLTKTRLPSEHGGNRRILDRVILTGQTCRLPRVREIVTAVFQEECERETSDVHWDPAALTFEGEYAKQAAALGAAYAQLLRDHRVPPDVQDTLNGNVLDIDIQNLFFFLQSGFKWRTPDRAEKAVTLLTPGRPFTEFDTNGVGRLRSEWIIKPSETTLIDRFDFESDGPTPWGEFDCQGLADRIQMPFRAFQSEVHMAIETDHRLVVSMLFCRGAERHYALPATADVLDLKALVQQLNLSAPGTDWLAAVNGWSLGINVLGGYGRELFGLSAAQFNMTFRAGAEGTPRLGVLSEELPACPDNGRDKFYIRPANKSRDWVEIGVLVRPQPRDRRRVSTRAILDETGQLRIHLGEVPFWLAATEEKLLDHGTVLRKPLSSPNMRPDDLRSPFCGRH